VSPGESSTLAVKEILHHVLTVEDPKGFRNFLLQDMTYSLGRSRPSSVNQLVQFMSLTGVYWADKPYILPVKRRLTL
jgi:hypothetical protein